MSLEFSKVVEQVQTMARYLGYRSQSSGDKLALALEWFYAATDIDAVHERIDLIRGQVGGYRGAAPAPQPYSEIISGVGPAQPRPEQATLVAADGSQIYPDLHAPASYYLMNIGTFAFYHGQDRLPWQMTHPTLYYSETDLQDKDGRLISNQTINARRSVAEVEWLGKQAYELRQEARPLIAFHDGGLLKFFGTLDVAGAQEVEHNYMVALKRLHDVRALLLGYIDVPRSTYVISLLHLLNLLPEQITENALKTNGPIEGLNDSMLFSQVLGPGDRSAIMVQNSPQNKEYKDRFGPDYEIGFFYLNVADGDQPNIARIDIPMWVARDAVAVDEMQSLVLAQCSVQGRKRYPYVLTRADELAYVSSLEKGELDRLIRINLLSEHLTPESSNKLQTKALARGERQQHRLRT